MTKSLRNPDRPPMHPGALLARHVIPNCGMTKSEIADRLGITRQTLHAICSEKAPVTPNVALRLGTLFGNGADIWFDLQARHDMWRAAKNFDAAVVNVKPVESARQSKRIGFPSFVPKKKAQKAAAEKGSPARQRRKAAA